MSNEKNRQADPKWTKNDCLLIAVVCDIRGFTDLTARVDEYSQSTLVPSGTIKGLVEAYSNYMQISQETASDLILKPLLKLKTDFSYALKSTGDGFLVAVKVADGVTHAVAGDNFQSAWSDIAVKLAEGLTQLIEDAELSKGKEKFGAKTRVFLEDWGGVLGFDLNQYEEKFRTGFRVAGAMAMGIGVLANRTETSEEPIQRFDDAYGHPVNLAFRLCEKAARENEEKKDRSPFILIDRRVARVLLRCNKNELNDRLNKRILKPYKHNEPLKGIEEAWCYAIEKE